MMNNAVHARNAAWLAALLLTLPGALQAQRQLLNRPLAILNEHVITERDLRTKIADQYGPTADPLNRTQRREALNTLMQILVLDEAGRKVTLDPDQLDAHVRQITQKEEQRKGSRSEFLAELFDRGKTYQDYLEEQREMARRGVYFHSLTRRLGPTQRPADETYVGPRELRRYYRANRQRFGLDPAIQGYRIRLLWSGAPTRAEVRQRARKLIAKLGAEPTAFRALAREHSAWNPEGYGELSGAPSGEARWVSLGPTSPLSAPQRLALAGASRAGLLPDPIEDEAGLELILVTALRASSYRPFEDPDVQRGIREQLEEQKDLRMQALSREEIFADAYYWYPEMRR